MGIFEQLAEMEMEEIQAKERREIIKRLLIQTELSMKTIADVVEVSLYYVQKVKKELRGS